VNKPLLYPLLASIMPGWDKLNENDRVALVSEVVGLAIAAFFSLIGIVWLVAATDWQVLRENWLMLALLTAFVFILDERLDFTVFLSPDDPRATASGSLSPAVIGSAISLFGPTALWIGLLPDLVSYIRTRRESSALTFRWSAIRNYAQSFAASTFCLLLGLAVYQWLGGTFPLSDLDARTLFAVVAALLVGLAGFVAITAPFLYFVIRYVAPAMQLDRPITLARNFILLLALNRVVELFGVLGSVMYMRAGAVSFFLGGLALIMGAVIAHRLSRAVSISTQRETSFKRLEAIGRAIINAPPDISHLPPLLQREGKDLFGASRFEVRLFDEMQLMREPDSNDWPLVPDEVWQRLREGKAHFVLPGLPVHGDQHVRRDALVAPIADADTGAVIGGIYVMRNRRRGPIVEFLSVAHVLAEQIASAALRVRLFQQELERRKTEQELEFAAKVQAGFLPSQAPQIEGWQMSATLESAKETSGDFFDYVVLPDGRLGVVIADVADKGMGAALFMTLSRTLMRTYAHEHVDQPHLVLHAVNRRMCEDARSDIFVTVLYGVLDPQTGEFAFCNAGHSPPILLCGDGSLKHLQPGNMALGIFPDIELKAECVCIAPGDTLVLHTDGLTDAQNAEGEFFGMERVRQAIRACTGKAARDVRESLYLSMKEFIAEAPLFDDVTLIVLRREHASVGSESIGASITG
jgi:serine phosphatase RsbU (regulator of sigma subunit)